jgi:60 kDa SS-A/Ro ribonucleoprotein
MTTKTYAAFSTKATPQTEPIPGETMVPNNAGGYAYALDKWAAFQRFLVLGTEGGTYYVKEKPLTAAGATNALACIAEDGARAVDLIVAISDAGRAPKNTAAEFALALAAAAKDDKTRALALAALPKVCRIPTHLFHFLTFVKQHRGFGRGLRRAVGDWYGRWTPEKLAFELAKYQGRDGWTNKDVLRQAHPKLDASRAAALRWAIGAPLEAREVSRDRGARTSRYGAAGPLPAVLEAMEAIKTADVKTAVALINTHGLTREMLPTELLDKAAVWEALLGTAERGMPVTALIRNLGNLSKCGLLTPMSAASKFVVARLGDQADLKRGRVHPVAVLLALKTYGSGKGLKGSGEWTPVPAVVDALDDAFYLAFSALEPTGKRLLFGIDVSGSMTSPCGGLPISCAEGAAAMAMACLKSEKDYFVMAFDQGFRDLGLTPKMRLDDVLKRTSNINGGGTNCALPMIYAREHNLKVDGFVVITDNETWAGDSHPSQELRRYRDTSGIAAKQVVIGMTATDITIADPKDPGALDCVGFDSTTPQVVTEFIR